MNNRILVFESDEKRYGFLSRIMEEFLSVVDTIGNYSSSFYWDRASCSEDFMAKARNSYEETVPYSAVVISEVCTETPVSEYIKGVIDILPEADVIVPLKSVESVEYNISVFTGRVFFIPDVIVENAGKVSLYSLLIKQCILKNDLYSSKEGGRSGRMAENLRRINQQLMDEISEKRRMKTQIIELEQKLDHFEKTHTIEQFTGGIVHDFNNLLSAIRGYSEILEEKIEDSKLSGFARKILDNSKKATDLTSKLLNIYKREESIQAVPVDMHKVVMDVMNILNHTLDKRIRVTEELKAEESCIMGNQSMLESLLLNIGLNARDAILKYGNISIVTENVLDKKEGRNLFRISVSDDGVGIEEKNLNKIFKPFYSTKKRGKGIGMGLFMVVDTVKKHSGIIDIKSKVNQGTTFIIDFPLTNQDVVVEKEEEEEFCSPCKGGSLMIVDDEEYVREYLSEVFDEQGYTVKNCCDGESAIETCSQGVYTPDIILLDMIMPGINGRETFDRLREIIPDAKVIFMSGYTLSEDVDYLLKH
ncbi:MAG: ATP-binding protein, partial [Chitinivibrionales bacterium]